MIELKQSTAIDNLINLDIDSHENQNKNTKIISRKKTNYGYLVTTFNPYVIITKYKIFVYSDGFIKVQVTRDMNYRPIERWTCYYTNKFELIDTKFNQTRLELSHWKKLRANNN